MDKFTKQFIMDMFLDTDSITDLNKLVVTVSDVIIEDNENSNLIDKMIQKQYIKNMIDKKLSGDDRRVHKKNFVNGYYEEIVLNYDDDTYQEVFKIKRSTVQKLISFLTGVIKSDKQLDLEKKVHVFLWLLTSGSSYGEVGALFGIPKSTVHFIMLELATLLSEHRYRFINWPSVEEQQVTSIKVNSRYNYPNCIGFIDCCRFKVGPKKKKQFTKSDIVLLQAVCDESYIFLDIHIGEIGNTDKYKVFRESSLSRELKNFVEFKNHILGDSKYKLKLNLITPLTSDTLSSEENKFNEVHSRVHSYIYQSFDMLRDRFRRLDNLDTNRTETVNVLLCAACVLHNFIMIHEGCSDVKYEVVSCNEELIIDSTIVGTAIEKRQYLCDYISYIENMG